MEWKTIDSAPRDLILVCDFSLDPEDYEGSVAVVWWEPYRNNHDSHKWVVSTCADHEEFEVVSIDFDEFKDIYSMTVSELVIIGELFFRKAKIYQDTIPVLPKLNKDVRNAVRNAISKMSFFHNQLNDIIENDKEEGAYALSGDFEELINHVSKAIDGDMRKYNQVFDVKNNDL